VRAVVQRVSRASVAAHGEVVGQIERGFLVFLGVNREDGAATAARLAEQVAGLRLFEDKQGKMNLGLRDVAGEVLCVSQFTLYGSVRRGRRPSFDEAAADDVARQLYEAFCAGVTAQGVRCAQGAFGEHMEVELVNDGPVTLIVDSRDLEAPRRD
jgi:D-tyrosyl-tRNA(Tyr) deacylase